MHLTPLSIIQQSYNSYLQITRLVRSKELSKHGTAKKELDSFLEGIVDNIVGQGMESLPVNAEADCSLVCEGV